MKFQKNIILNKINNGFSLIEMVMAVSIATLLMASIITAAFILHRGFLQTKSNAIKIDKMAYLSKEIALDVLNPDTFPHHPQDQYELNNNSIAFFAKGTKVIYKYENDIFEITRDEKITNYEFIKDFNIKYYDIDGYEYFEVEEFPYKCILYFVFSDNKELSIEMRL